MTTEVATEAERAIQAAVAEGVSEAVWRENLDIENNPLTWITIQVAIDERIEAVVFVQYDNMRHFVEGTAVLRDHSLGYWRYATITLGDTAAWVVEVEFSGDEIVMKSEFTKS